MPLILDNGRIPPVWVDRQRWRPTKSVSTYYQSKECLRLALINNMPDPALEDTELQFFDLLDSAATDFPVYVELYSMPNVLRSDRALQHLRSFYHDIGNLLNNQFDGVIVTGTEPRQSDLRCESYWLTLTDVLDWAEDNTVSAVLSCLAAHASVLHSDGIERYSLQGKQFGVFEYNKVCEHDLTTASAERVRFPHSRWNEVRQEDLIRCGYSVLTQSVQAGVDLFVKKRKRSLFVHFQGHPEYGTLTLFKEFRRDIKRFLKGERETYPSMPSGYFDAATAELLAAFREKALTGRGERVLPEFPEAELTKSSQNTWRSSATCIYRNWLRYVASRKALAPAFHAVAKAGLG